MEEVKRGLRETLHRITLLENEVERLGKKGREEKTWAKVGQGGERKAKEEERERKEEEVRKKEEERVKRQRAVIEVVPDSQVKGPIEGEELIRMAEEAGVARNEIESITMVRGRMRIQVKEGEEARIVRRVNETKKVDGKAAARHMESWAGLVVYGMEKEWNREGGMKGLKEWFEKGWGVELMKEPR